jgi:AcrR family transcriptional regulator
LRRCARLPCRRWRPRSRPSWPPCRPGLDPAEAARAHLRAVGTGYLRFAQAEPGLFRTAFSVPADLQNTTRPARADNTGMKPFQLLAAALDELVDVGVLPRDRRPGAELLAWSAVHGLAVLLIDGPLRSLDHPRTHSIEQRLLDLVERGL